MKTRTTIIAALALLGPGAAFSIPPVNVSPYAFIGSSHCRVQKQSIDVVEDSFDAESSETKYSITTVKNTIFASCRWDTGVAFDKIITFPVPYAPQEGFTAGSYCKVHVGNNTYYAGAGFVTITKRGKTSVTCIASKANQVPF